MTFVSHKEAPLLPHCYSKGPSCNLTPPRPLDPAHSQAPWPTSVPKHAASAAPAPDLHPPASKVAPLF